MHFFLFFHWKCLDDGGDAGARAMVDHMSNDALEGKISTTIENPRMERLSSCFDD